MSVSEQQEDNSLSATSPEKVKNSNIKERLNLHVKRRLQESEVSVVSSLNNTQISNGSNQQQQQHHKRGEKVGTQTGRGGKRTKTKHTHSSVSSVPEDDCSRDGNSSCNDNTHNREKDNSPDILTLVLNEKKRSLMRDPEVLGLLPFNTYDPETTFVDYILMSTIPLIYSISSAVMHAYDYMVPKVGDCLAVCYIADCLFAYLGLFSYVVSSLRAFGKKQFFIKFSTALEAVEEEIKWCNQKTPREVQKKDNFQLILLATGTFLYFFGITFDTVTAIKFVDVGFVPFTILGSFAFLTSSLVQSQFIILIHNISNKFVDLNQILETISEESDSKCEQLKIFDIETEIAATSELEEKKIKDMQKNERDEKDPNEIKEERKDTERFMVNVFKLHDQLCEIGVITNREFAVQIVAYMTATFIISVFGIFLETKVIFIVGGMRPYLDMLATSFVIWGGIFLLVAYMVLRMCCRAQRESKRTALLVHEIMQKKPAFMLGNDVYYNRMKCFTLQYLHWENYFHFNGIGLFQLDYTFIFSAISAATSYLIVLLQFDLSNVM